MLQAKGFETWTETSSSSPAALEENRFPYGWRYVTRRLPTGQEVSDQIPLTAYDLLHPQEDDQVPQRNEHFQPIVDLVASLKTYYVKDPTMGVFGDLIMDWGIPGLSQSAPDIAIVPNVKQKDAARGTFYVAQEGTRPGVVMEVMSPGSAVADTDYKRTLYERAGIVEYFLIQPHLEREWPYYSLHGYRLVKGVYRRIPTKKGRLLSQTLQLWLEVTDQGRQVRVTEVATGRRLLTQVETEEARLAAEARVKVAEAHAEAEMKARVEEATAHAQTEVARLAAEARAAALEQRLRELESQLKSQT